MNKPLISIDQLMAQSLKIVQNEWKATLKWTLGMTAFSFAVQVASTLYRISNPGTHTGVLLLTLVMTIAGAFYFTAGLFKQLMEKIVPATHRPDLSKVFGYGLVALLITIPMVALGFIFLIIPGIWVSVSIGFVMTYLVDGKKPLEAISASFNLVKGRWWAVCGRNIVAGIIALAISMVVGFITLAVGLLLALFGAGSIAASGMTIQTFFQTMSVHPGQSLGLLALLLVFVLFILAISLVKQIFDVLFFSAWNILLYTSLKETPVEVPVIEPTPATTPTQTA